MPSLWATFAGLLGWVQPRRIGGKHAVIAGGGGIASSLVQLLLDAGVVVHVIDKSSRNLADLKKRTGPSSALHTYEVDMTDDDAFESVAHAIKSAASPDHISILIHTAVILNRGSVESLPIKKRRDIFDVNVVTWYSCMRLFLPEMKSRRDGHIVTFSSVVAYAAGSSASDYCGTKAALLAMHNSLRLELIRDGFADSITTSVIHPYLVDTELFAGAQLKLKWILPKLRAEQVAQATFDAILYGRKTVFVPRTIVFLCMVNVILPTFLQDVLYKVSGAVDFLKTSDRKDV